MTARRFTAFLGLSLASWAHAAEQAPERPVLPAASIAAEDGADAIWENPSNLAFDPDPSYALSFEQALEEGGASAFSAAGNTGPLGVGLLYRSAPDGLPRWTLSSALGLKLERDLALGLNVGWQIPTGDGDEGRNFATWDLGLGYRPLPWLGLAGLVQNVGLAHARNGVEQRYGGGVAFRPWRGDLTLGLDYLLTARDGSSPLGVGQASARIHPASGVFVRLSGDTTGAVGAGLELFFGAAGVGAYGDVAVDGQRAPTALVTLASGEPGERLVGGRKKVPVVTIDSEVPYQPVAGLFRAQGETWVHLLERVRKAAEASDVKGLVLHLDESPGSMAQIEELRGVIAQARDHGKPVLAYLDRASSNGAYMLACAADRIYLHPAAQIDLVGLSAEMQFFRGALDLVGVEPQFARRAEYKSAVEAYMNTESSPASREQTNALLDDLSARLVGAVAECRGRTVEQVRELIDRGPFTAEEALNAGLVDGLLYPDALDSALDPLFPKGYDLDEEWGLLDDTRGWRASQEVAVVYVDGTIVSGPSVAPGLLSGGRMSGSDTIVSQLEQAGHESSVKAVILRVDSPGGSAFASDEIWRAVERVRREKPVVVSMGGVAASGGYYVSAGATAIYALPSTITGSIGVFSGKMSLEGLYEKIGLSYEVYNRGRNAALYSMSKPFDDQELAVLDRLVSDTYRQFKEKVERGRRLSTERVEEVARGRVWSGARAKEQGLVDGLGGFYEALARAREEAGIPERAPVELVSYRSGPVVGELSRSAVKVLAPGLAARLDARPLLPPELALLEQWRALSTDPVWALMPYRLEVR